MAHWFEKTQSMVVGSMLRAGPAAATVYVVSDVKEQRAQSWIIA